MEKELRFTSGALGSMCRSSPAGSVKVSLLGPSDTARGLACSDEAARLGLARQLARGPAEARRAAGLAARPAHGLVAPARARQ
jgi:hypothetical protein